MSTVLEVSQLSYSAPGGRMLQENLSFRLVDKQLALITGSNGCGKSTLLKALLGDFDCADGEIRFSVPDARIEYIPQLENTEIHFPLTLQDVLNLSAGRKVSWAEISSYGLLREDLLSAAWNTASGGERKRTLLTRALLKAPQVLILDEPMNHLDVESRRTMVGMMSRFLRSEHSEKRAIVMVCHQGLPPAEAEQFDVVSLNLDSRRGIA